jgi:glycosyltransferase involved in cell wall biosynthesis
VIIPAYNSAAFLAEAVGSVLEQSFQDFEIIIVDDGSNDNTRAVCAQFPTEKVRTIFQKNMGSPGARNTGIHSAAGEYIAFLDADDWFLPDKLALQVQELDSRRETGLISGGWSTINDRGETIRVDRPWQVFPNIDARLLLYECPLVVHSVLVRRSWLEKVGQFDASIKYVEDWDLWVRLALAGCKMAWNEALVCKRRMHAQNKSWDARKTKAGILATLEKVIASGLPQPLDTEKNHILAYWRLVIAAGEYAAAGLEQDASTDLAAAVNLDPSLLVGNPSIASKVLASYANNVFVTDAASFIRRVMENLPAEARVLRHARRKILASAFIQKSFVYHSLGLNRQRSTAVLSGVCYDPGWLRDRGVFSLAFEGIFGASIAGAARRILKRMPG